MIELYQKLTERPSFLGKRKTPLRAFFYCTISRILFRTEYDDNYIPRMCVTTHLERLFLRSHFCVRRIRSCTNVEILPFHPLRNSCESVKIRHCSHSYPHTCRFHFGGCGCMRTMGVTHYMLLYESDRLRGITKLVFGLSSPAPPVDGCGRSCLVQLSVM